MAKKKISKKITAAFSVAALFAGFLFIDRSVTGNVVLNNHNPVNFVSLVGLLLVFCSAILALYSIRR